jgi:nucleotide-binding universal stress UspA family protein
MSGQQAIPAGGSTRTARELIEKWQTSGVPLSDRLRSGRVLVAVTGGPDASGAIAIAHAVERRYGSAVLAIQVLDTSVAALPAPLSSAFTMARGLIGDAPYAQDVAARQRQFAEITGAPNEWPVHVSVGTPSEEILRYARKEGVALITMGLRRHGIAHRVLDDETTLTVARHARGTVLGVVPDLRGLPRRAVVGVDFGPASVHAARAALDLLARPVSHEAAALRLVYVDRDVGTEPEPETAGTALIARLGVHAAFEQLVQQLDAPANVRVDCITLYGSPAQELLALATETESDLIAVGSLRHERVERWILGSVTTDVIRDGRCSVLVIPPPR